MPQHRATPETLRHRRAVKRERKLLRLIADAQQCGKAKRATHFTKSYLRSPDAKFVAAATANRKLPPSRRVTPDALEDLARRLDPWEGSGEPARVRPIPKRGTEAEFRPTIDFGLERRTLHNLLLRPLSILVGESDQQFGSTAGGTPAAVDAILRHIYAGDAWVVRTDVKDCFPSFAGEQVGSLLPLPGGPAERGLTSLHTYLVMAPGATTQRSTFPAEEDDESYLQSWLLSHARRGLPQGSAASPLVAEALIRPVLEQLRPLGRVVSYLDDILLLAPTERDAVSMLQALIHGLDTMRAGPLRLKTKSIRSAKVGFEFLGLQFRPGRSGLVVQPTPDKLEEKRGQVTGQLYRARRSVMPPDIVREDLARLRKFVLAWTGGLKACWPGAMKFRAELVSDIDALVSKLGDA